METIRAIVENLDGKRFLKMEIGDEEISIPMSEDKPKAVKHAFNKIISRIKDGAFQIELEGVGDDLFSQVANEYVKQLNREIQEIYGDMREYGLVK